MRIVVVVFAGLMLAVCSQSMRELSVEIPQYEGGYKINEGDEWAPALTDLRSRLASWGVTVGEAAMQPFGTTDTVNRVIILRQGMPINAQFETLAHEAAHLFQPPSIEIRSHAEVFAEEVAVRVTAFYGHKDYKHASARYIALYKPGLSVLPDLEVDIAYATKALTGRAPLPASWQQ